MTRLEDLQPNAAVRGIPPDALVTVVSVQWFGSEALEVKRRDATCRDAEGNKRSWLRTKQLKVSSALSLKCRAQRAMSRIDLFRCRPACPLRRGSRRADRRATAPIFCDRDNRQV